MKQLGRMLTAVAALALLGGVATAAPKKKAPAPKKVTFQIETNHREAECMAAMEEIVAAHGKKKGEPAMLKNTVWGCRSGDHRGWTTVSAVDQEAALATLPEGMRASAKVVQVEKLTVKDYKAAKKKMEKEKAGAM